MAAGLDQLPDVVAVHSTAPEYSRIDATKSVAQQLMQLTALKPARCYGIIAGVNCATLHKAVTRQSFEDINVSTAQLFRNPIMVAEAAATRTSEGWGENKKHTTWAVTASASILANRLGQAKVTWPDSVRACVLNGDETTFARIAGMWARLDAAAAEAAGYELLTHHMATKGSGAILGNHPIFRFEDFTSDIAVFRKLVEHVTSESVDDDVLSRIFAIPALRKHRSNDVNDPNQVYDSWHPAERDFFNTVLRVTRLRKFHKDRNLYSLPEEWSDAPPDFGLPETPPYNNVTINLAALMPVSPLDYIGETDDANATLG